MTTFGEMVVQSQRKAAWLWRLRLLLAGSVAKIYLRDCRGYRGPLPLTLAFLPPTDQYPPAMAGALGLAREIATRGSGDRRREVRARHKAAAGWLRRGGQRLRQDHYRQRVTAPVILAPCSDSLGLIIAEEIEDALSAVMAGKD